MSNGYQKFHPGYVESCHEPRSDSRWYRKEGYPPHYCDALENGGYTVCGNSGSRPWCIDSRGILDTRADKIELPCCCFVTGSECTEKVLKRRWTCCRKEFTGTFFDCLIVSGCQAAYNLTD
jgi:hypothetical protein